MKLFFKAFLFIDCFFFLYLCPKIELYRLGLSVIPLGVLTRKGINVSITARITFHVNRLDHARPLLKEMKALNVYEINLIQTLKFMHKTKYGKIHGFSFLNFVR